MVSSKGKKAITTLAKRKALPIEIRRNRVEEFLKLSLYHNFIKKGYSVFLEKQMNPIMNTYKMGSVDSAITNLPFYNSRKIYRADVLCVNTKAEIIICEIKSSLQDFKTDKKYLNYMNYCDKLYIVVTGDWLIDDIIDDIPKEVGIVHVTLNETGHAVFRYVRKAKKLHSLLVGTRYGMMVSLCWHSGLSLKNVLKSKPNYFQLYRD